MKILTTQFIICLLLSYSMQAFDYTYGNIDQLTTTVQDSTKEKNRTISISIGDNDDDDDKPKKKNKALRIGMMDLGISSYLTEDGSLDMPEDLAYLDQRLIRSVNVGIHIVNIKVGLNKKESPQRFGLSTGLKWNIVHYSMEQDYRLAEGQRFYTEAIDYEVPELKKNRLKANYLQIPFMFEFNSNPNNESKSFNLAFGYVQQFMLNSNYKYKTEGGEKVKTKGDFNLTKSMGLAEVRLGYGPLNFYVQYGLKNLFQDNTLEPEMATNVTPINFGVNIIPR